MTERWRLRRAGITNVYQYADETLEFGGGRLLLRGVNGSGKSTAMNMLLPFLLDADTRRIDAAGEQASVLKSWMLSGRDEPQPVGYLWVEFEGAGEHVVCGCGIRASRSTDRVTTWWFVTDQRPGIDLALVEHRVPLSVDALRAKLGPHAVFTHEQRATYRATVRARLYGGADIDQHIRLLHVVRSPRVGDRIDAELPEYLDGALPQLSEAALDDAAQPLEDLEEHRRNVEDLSRTAETLEALTATYRSYARAELRGRADELVAAADEVRRLSRVEQQCQREAGEARSQLDAATAAVAAREGDERRLREEIDAMKASPAYQQGQELEDLRAHVRTLAAACASAEAALERSRSLLLDATAKVRSAQQGFGDDEAVVTRSLAALGLDAAAVGLAVAPPDAPTVEVIEHPDLGAHTPHGPLPTGPTRARLADVRAAAHQRQGDVDELRATLRVVDQADRALAEAERYRATGALACDTARERLVATRTVLDQRLATWRTALHAWVDHLDQQTGAALDRTPLGGADLLDRRDDVARQLSRSADELMDRRQQAVAAVALRQDAEVAEVARLDAELDALAALAFPEPPLAAWQRPRRAPCLAELIDFVPSLPDHERAGLEGAMEAAGLLNAEVGDDGALRLESGELVVVAAAQAAQPLSRLVVVTIPAELEADVDAGALGKVLDAISVLPHPDAHTMVGVDGSFRIGALHGRHTKAAAELVGATARRAALERQRAALVTARDQAAATLLHTEGEVAEARAGVAAAQELRSVLPTTTILTEAFQAVLGAEDRLDEATAHLEQLESSVARAEEAHAEAAATSGRVAASRGLPAGAASLESFERTVRSVIGRCDEVAQGLVTLERSFERWTATAATGQQRAEEVTERTTDLQDARDQHEPRAMRLATLEDTVGLEYAEVQASLALSERDLAGTTVALREARAAKDHAVRIEERARGLVEVATKDRSDAAERCIALLPAIRLALAVPGLLAAAFPAVDPSQAPPVFGSVAATPEGVRTLAGAILAALGEPDRTSLGADGVRQSLRQRRDALGAGWDAEDQQPDPALPLTVEVTGPLGRMPLPAASALVRAQLDQQASLLTAKQDQALRNLLQGLIAREVAEKLHAAGDLVERMNQRLDAVSTAHGIGARLRWKRRPDLDEALTATIDLLAKPPDLRSAEEDQRLTAALSTRIEAARRMDPEAPYRALIADVLDYRRWHEMAIFVRRAGRNDERLTRRTPLSEGEKKVVSYLPLFAAVAASCDALAEAEPNAPRFVLLDDAFAKVSEDNHAQLFGLLVELDLDFIATSERLWGTHATVPELAITEVLRDAELGVIVLEHSRWDGVRRSGP